MYEGDKIQTTTLTIASGASLSDAINLNGRSDGLAGLRLFSLVLPALTSAAITFQSSRDGGTTWNNLYDATNTEITIPASTGAREIVLDPVIFSSITHLKIRSGTAASAVNQAAARTITLVLRSI